MMATGTCSRMAPPDWDETFSGLPDLCSRDGAIWPGALLRRWRDTARCMEQPPLDHHYLVLHLGGAKRIERRAAGSVTRADAQLGAVTLVAAGTAYSWTTEGPIGFAHLYLHPSAIDRVVSDVFNRDPRSVELIDCVASRLPLISALMTGMLEGLEGLEAPAYGARLVLDTLLHSLIVRLLLDCSTLSEANAPAPMAIAPRRLKRVLDYMESNLSVDIALDDLASAAGSSRFHFSHAFRRATGVSPYRYLINRRIESAKALLMADDLTIAEVAARCGFNSPSQFAAMFRRVSGTTPGRFRRIH